MPNPFLNKIDFSDNQNTTSLFELWGIHKPRGQWTKALFSKIAHEGEGVKNTQKSVFVVY